MLLHRSHGYCPREAPFNGASLAHMDRAMLTEHLLLAERHVTQGTSNLERQLQRVKELRGDARDDWRSRSLLSQFETLLALHIEDRDRVAAELAKSDIGRTR